MGVRGLDGELPGSVDIETVPRHIFWRRLKEEMSHAYVKHGDAPWGRHEFAAILREEFEELWDAIKTDAPTEEVLKEAVQVAAMCLRYWETNDRYRGPHTFPARWRE